mmetsp:Transcript_10055/g.15067  ORF Transcript_10055/g.15067 Transcript_10055/m.15067 type:complete len:656 (-) Transcript_10055:51-2018(-)|eukprot:CAMPEP_0116011214 /NCGR_PEP_ID=MMETSP0321-20121206/4440_1 /TAXON_ID=163516 /ORGANISM="Leptocylindrus danicus var. danicus, Strain B650" /LENGTH=655 /DNA_ID=CAMNT_0003480415 /DNA_START=81 /DNA_END=2048 /DNA_ORIENTATION=-
MSWLWQKKEEGQPTNDDSNKGNVEVFWGQKGSVSDDEEVDDVTEPASSAEDITADNNNGESTAEENELLWKSFMNISIRGAYDDDSSSSDDDSDNERSTDLRDSKTSIGTNGTNCSVGSAQVRIDEERVKENLQAWVGRCRRVDVFQSDYKPTETEALEVQDIVKELQIGDTSNENRRSSSMNIIKRHSNSVQSKARNLLCTNSKGAPDSDKGKAVLLLKGPLVLLNKGSRFGSNKRQTELIVFNNSFIIVNVNVPSPDRRTMFSRSKIGNGQIPIQKSVEVCEELSSVVALVDLAISLYSHKGYKSSQVFTDETADDDSEEDENRRSAPDKKYNQHGFRIVLPSKSYSLVCVSDETKQMWIDCLSVAIMNAKKRASSNVEEQKESSEAQVNVDVDKEHTVLRTSIFSSVICGDHDMLEKVLESDRLPVDTPDSKGLTALHYAVINNRKSFVRTLLDAGADVNRQDLTGKTPGFYGKSKRVLDLLAASGANLDDFPELSEDKVGEDKHSNDDHNTCSTNTSKADTSPKPAKKSILGMFNAISEDTNGESPHNDERDDTNGKTRDRNVPKDNTSPGPTKPGKKNILGMLNAINERGEVLEETNESASKLKDEAISFKSLAKQILEQQKEKNENDSASKFFRMTIGAMKQSKRDDLK